MDARPQAAPGHRRSPRLAAGLRRLRPALAVLAIAAVLALIPSTTCLVRIVTGVPCPGCGITRATLAAAHLHFAEAQRFHPLSLALIATTAAMVGLAFVASDAVWRRAVTVVTGVAGVALVVVWALRFAGLFGGPVPG